MLTSPSAPRWHEARIQAHEEWGRPDQVPEHHVSESEASYNFDLEVYKYLVDSAPDEREKQRLLRVAQDHAGVRYRSAFSRRWEGYHSSPTSVSCGYRVPSRIAGVK